jgi:hypothetical protein
MFKLLIILPCLITVFQPLNAKVDPPNYDFSLDTLSDFNPGKSNSELEKKYGKAELVEEKSGVQTLRFYVAHIRYKFPVIIQSRDGIVLDYFARLPSYFLHDIFFQSIINRQGKQTEYKRVGEEAVYVWNKVPLKMVYSAACTITCFPVFYAVFSEGQTPPPLLQQMKNAAQRK